MLDAGKRRYKAIDLPIPWVRADNCIHAITGAIPGFGNLHYPLQMYGEPSGRHIVEELEEHGMILSEGHDWLLDQLCPDLGERDSTEPAGPDPAPRS